MDVTVKPSLLSGSIRAVASKSYAHRMLIAAALSDTGCQVSCPETSKDIEATAGCLNALGAHITYDSGAGLFNVTPVRRSGISAESPTAPALLDAAESGSTLRFILPIVCTLNKTAKIYMRGRLPERPLSPLWEELINHGAVLKRTEGGSCIEVSGRFTGGTFTLAADVSSQFISGLLFALPLLKDKSEIKLEGLVSSRDYIIMTMDSLKAFGVYAAWEEGRIFLKEGSRYTSPGRAKIEGDWSNAAFWLCADRLGSQIKVSGLNGQSAQGDRAALSCMDQIEKGGAVIDAANIPDLVPVLSVLAAVTPGETRFINAERLKIKESDRIKSTICMVNSLGGKAFETPGGLTVRGVEKLSGGTVESFNDHRIAMSAAVAALACTGNVTIKDAGAVSKSYPGFFDDFKKLGGVIIKEE